MTGKLKCLLVDADVYSLRELKNLVLNSPLLELEQTCKTGRAAANLLRTEKIDVLILNPALPDVNGFDLVANLDDCPPVIIVSDRTDYAHYAFRVGAYDYRVKPLTAAQLEDSLKRVVRAREVATELEQLRKELGKQP